MEVLSYIWEEIILAQEETQQENEAKHVGFWVERNEETHSTIQKKIILEKKKEMKKYKTRKETRMPRRRRENAKKKNPKRNKNKETIWCIILEYCV